MNKVCWIIFALATAFCATGQAAEKVSAATRAYLYQHEARTTLIARGWHISRDEPGKIVADHPLGLVGTIGGNVETIQLGLNSRPVLLGGSLHAFAWLTITFKAESVSRTKCAANVVAYKIWVGMKKGEAKPFPFNNPDTTKEIQDMMVKAEQALGTKHLEYARD